MTAILNSLTEKELEIARSAEAGALVDLDEDGLLDLHLRIRRARDKYLSQYRRSAADRITDVGGRGKAYEQNQRLRDKAEVFETALARVSTAVAKAARAAAADLKAERLAAAQAADGAGPAPRNVPAARAVRSASATDTSTARRAPQKTSGQLKRDAGDIAVGRRNQAKRDNR